MHRCIYARFPKRKRAFPQSDAAPQFQTGFVGSATRFIRVVAVVLFVICWPRLLHAADLTLAWDPPTDGVTTGYILFYGEATGSYSREVDVGYVTSYTLNGLPDGTTYYFTVRAYDATGATSDRSAEVSAAALPTVPPVVTWLALNADVPPPQIVGTTVTWRATAAGGVAPNEYQWALYGGGQWTVWPWTDSPTWAWTPWTPGDDYQIRVAVRSSASGSTDGQLSESMPFTVTRPPPSITPLKATVTLQPDVAPPQIAGNTINWSATGSGGAAPYEYQWWLWDGSVWSATAWITNSKWSWTPPAASSDYFVLVWVRSAGNSSDYPEASAAVSFPIVR